MVPPIDTAGIQPIIEESDSGSPEDDLQLSNKKDYADS